MECRCYYIDSTNEIMEISTISGELSTKLATKEGLKFVLDIWLDNKEFKPVLTLAIGEMKHSRLLGRQQSFFECLGNYRHVEMGPIWGTDGKNTDGGGSVRIRKDILIFFSDSAGLDRYNKHLVERMFTHLMQVFGVYAFKLL